MLLQEKQKAELQRLQLTWSNGQVDQRLSASALADFFTAELLAARFRTEAFVPSPSCSHKSLSRPYRLVTVLFQEQPEQLLLSAPSLRGPCSRPPRSTERGSRCRRLTLIPVNALRDHERAGQGVICLSGGRRRPPPRPSSDFEAVTSEPPINRTMTTPLLPPPSPEWPCSTSTRS